MIYIYISLIFLFLLVLVALGFYINDKQKIRAIITMPDRSIKIVKRKPSGVDKKQIKVGESLYDIDDVNFTVYKNKITYFYTYNVTTPLDPYTKKASLFSPEQYNLAIESKVEREILNSINKGVLDMPMMSMILLLVVIGALGIIAYLGNDKLTAMQEQLQYIIDALKSIGVGGLDA